jgi:hypothetical protein
MNHIIESIGHWGVKTTHYARRIGIVRPGDIIEAPEDLRRYPVSHRHSRIESIGEDGIAHICEGMGSAYLREDGSCSISGGPFWSMPVSLLEPMHSLYEAVYWNWGDNGPGAGHGVYYRLERPLHCLTVHPYDFQYRWAADERGARQPQFSHEEPLGQEWKVILRGKREVGGEFLWLFRRISGPVIEIETIRAELRGKD